jgi:hypothetical protein
MERTHPACGTQASRLLWSASASTALLIYHAEGVKEGSQG